MFGHPLWSVFCFVFKIFSPPIYLHTGGTNLCPLQEYSTYIWTENSFILVTFITTTVNDLYLLHIRFAKTPQYTQKLDMRQLCQIIPKSPTGLPILIASSYRPDSHLPITTSCFDTDRLNQIYLIKGKCFCFPHTDVLFQKETSYFGIIEGIKWKLHINAYSRRFRNVYTILTASGIVNIDAKSIFWKFKTRRPNDPI